MAKLDTAALKEQANAAYAARFRQRDKASRRAARRKRMEVREMRWLLAMGIPRDPSAPLI